MLCEGVCKCHAALDRQDQLQLRGLKLFRVVTAWARYVYSLQKTLVTLVLLPLNSTVYMLKLKTTRIMLQKKKETSN